MAQKLNLCRSLSFRSSLISQIFTLNQSLSVDIPERLCGSVQSNQLHFLKLGIDGGNSPTPKFVMKSKPFPTQLALTNCPPTTIDIGWDNITHAILCDLTADECLEVLERAPLLKYLHSEFWDHSTINPSTSILHRRLQKLADQPNFHSQPVVECQRQLNFT